MYLCVCAFIFCLLIYSMHSPWYKNEPVYACLGVGWVLSLQSLFKTLIIGLTGNQTEKSTDIYIYIHLYTHNIISYKCIYIYHILYFFLKLAKAIHNINQSQCHGIPTLHSARRAESPRTPTSRFPSA